MQVPLDVRQFHKPLDAIFRLRTGRNSLVGKFEDPILQTEPLYVCMWVGHLCPTQDCSKSSVETKQSSNDGLFFFFRVRLVRSIGCHGDVFLPKLAF